MHTINSRIAPYNVENAIQAILAKTLSEGGSLAFWRKPLADEKLLFICHRGVSEHDEINVEEFEPGFVFAPFLPEKKKIYLRADLIFKFKGGTISEGEELLRNYPLFDQKKEEGDHKINFHYKNNQPISPSSYQDLVWRSVMEIERGSFEKVVPSRFKDVSISESFDLLKAFDTLCSQHPTALVSLFSSPQTGTWLGASPELLVSVDSQSKFKTHALAGTLPISPGMDLKSVAWTQKEIEEQALVCRYIINCFKKIRLREYQEHGPKTIVAGNVMHLKTDYEVDMKEVNFPQLGSVMLKLLHPTSAVCGMPLEASMKFLKEHEGYDREFYSGYLGPVNYQNETNIFVNLRCTQLAENNARLYAGAGVTVDSTPQKEWEETEMKMKNMLGVLVK
jgi:isochorismate synthase